MSLYPYIHIFQIHIEWPSKIRSKGVFFVKKELEKISENEECMLNSLVCGDIHSNVLGIEMQFNFCVFYRVSHKSDFTLFLLISQILEHVQRNFWPLFNSPGNWLHDRHKNFENWFKNSWDNWGQSWHPSFRNWHFAITKSKKNNLVLQVPTLTSIISAISESIFKILVAIM